MSNKKLAKDDVIWVPYRRDPLWPALVQNAYPKKVTYCFFPLQNDGAQAKKSTFSCHPKHAYALVPAEPIVEGAEPALIAAFRAASNFLKERGRTRGADCESLGEAMAREDAGEEGAEKWRNKRAGKKRREQSEDEENGSPSPKKLASTSSERSSPSLSYQQPQCTEEQSKEMMQLIDDRFESLVEEVLSNLVDLKKAAMREKMTVKLRNNQFLSDSDYEKLFERLVVHIRSQNPEISLITAFSFTASHAIPHVLIETYATWKNVDIDAAKEIFYQLNNRILGLDTAMEIPVTNQMEELCRLACDEHSTI